MSEVAASRLFCAPPKISYFEYESQIFLGITTIPCGLLEWSRLFLSLFDSAFRTFLLLNLHVFVGEKRLQSLFDCLILGGFVLIVFFLLLLFHVYITFT